MKRLYFLPILCSVMVLLIIFSFHSYENLLQIISPSSEKWPREVYMDNTPYKKPVSIEMDKDNVWILGAKEDRFTKIRFDKNKLEISETNDIVIPGAELNKLVKYQSGGSYIFWTENYELYMSKRINETTYEEKTLVLENVKDFNVLLHEGITFLLTADESGIRYFRVEDNGLVQLGDLYPFKNPILVSASVDDDSVFHIAAIRQISSMEKEIIYLQFYNDKWLLKGQKVEYAQISIESVGNLEIGLDRDLAYIFYENNVWNNWGQTAKTLYATVPLNDSKKHEMNFKLLKPLGRDNDSNLYISEVRCPNEQKEELTALFIENHNDETGLGFRVLNVFFKDGVIVHQLPATKVIDYIKGINMANYEKEEALTFLEVAEGFKYDVYFTQTGEEYFAAVTKAKKQDYVNAVLTSISPFINGLVIAVVKAFMFLPAVLWLVMIEVFQIKKFVNKNKVNFAIAISIYLIIKLMTADSYYTGLSSYMIPSFMKSVGLKYSIMIAISVISYLMTKLWKRTKINFHIIGEFLLFMLYDLLITVFLYSPYII